MSLIHQNIYVKKGKKNSIYKSFIIKETSDMKVKNDVASKRDNFRMTERKMDLTNER